MVGGCSSALSPYLDTPLIEATSYEKRNENSGNEEMEKCRCSDLKSSEVSLLAKLDSLCNWLNHQAKQHQFFSPTLVCLLLGLLGSGMDFFYLSAARKSVLPLYYKVPDFLKFFGKQQLHST